MYPVHILINSVPTVLYVPNAHTNQLSTCAVSLFVSQPVSHFSHFTELECLLYAEMRSPMIFILSQMNPPAPRDFIQMLLLNLRQNTFPFRYNYPYITLVMPMSVHSFPVSHSFNTAIMKVVYILTATVISVVYSTWFIIFLLYKQEWRRDSVIGIGNRYRL